MSHNESEANDNITEELCRLLDKENKQKYKRKKNLIIHLEASLTEVHPVSHQRILRVHLIIKNYLI